MSGWAAEADSRRDDNSEEQEELKENAVKVSTTKDKTSPAPTTQRGTALWFLRSRTPWQQGLLTIPENFPLVTVQHIRVSYPAPSPRAKYTGGIFQLGPSSVSGPLILREQCIRAPFG